MAFQRIGGNNNEVYSMWQMLLELERKQAMG